MLLLSAGGIGRRDLRGGSDGLELARMRPRKRLQLRKHGQQVLLGRVRAQAQEVGRNGAGLDRGVPDAEEVAQREGRAGDRRDDRDGCGRDTPPGAGPPRRRGGGAGRPARPGARARRPGAARRSRRSPRRRRGIPRTHAGARRGARSPARTARCRAVPKPTRAPACNRLAAQGSACVLLYSLDVRVSPKFVTATVYRPEGPDDQARIHHTGCVRGCGWGQNRPNRAIRRRWTAARAGRCRASSPARAAILRDARRSFRPRRWLHRWAAGLPASRRGGRLPASAASR